MTLSNWDSRLLKLYLTRYKRLASGLSQPTSNKEMSFVNFIRNKTKPKTQHEVAYSRYLEINEKIELGLKYYGKYKMNKLLKDRGIRCLIHQPSYSMINRWKSDL